MHRRCRSSHPRGACAQLCCVLLPPCWYAQRPSGLRSAAPNVEPPLGTAPWKPVPGAQRSPLMVCRVECLVCPQKVLLSPTERINRAPAPSLPLQSPPAALRVRGGGKGAGEARSGGGGEGGGGGGEGGVQADGHLRVRAGHTGPVRSPGEGTRLARPVRTRFGRCHDEHGVRWGGRPRDRGAAELEAAAAARGDRLTGGKGGNKKKRSTSP